MKTDLVKRLEVMERRRVTNEDNRFSVTLVFDGAPGACKHACCCLHSFFYRLRCR
jgi:hypothetical protein